MKSPSEWIDLNSAFEHPTESAEHDLNLVIMVSPYDVPEAVRGYHSDGKGRFIIEFRYIGSEPQEQRSTGNEHVFLRVGKNSGRLYAIEIDVNALKAESVSLHVGIGEIEKSLDNLIAHPIKPVRVENYKLVREALHVTQDQLLRSATEVGVPA